MHHHWSARGPLNLPIISSKRSTWRSTGVRGLRRSGGKLLRDAVGELREQLAQGLNFRGGAGTGRIAFQRQHARNRQRPGIGCVDRGATAHETLDVSENTLTAHHRSVGALPNLSFYFSYGASLMARFPSLAKGPPLDDGGVSRQHLVASFRPIEPKSQ